jgi:hypothetical protein
MAQSVLIDIPGIGQVEAKNAASEATLQEMLKIMRKFDKSTDGGKKSGAGSAAGAAGGAAGAAGGAAGKGAAAGGSTAGKGQSLLGKAAFAAGMGIAKLDTAAKTVLGGFRGLAEGSVETIDKFAQVGDSLTAAAGIFRNIPIVGPMFGAVAQAVTSVTDAYQNAAQSGATFSGSVNEFSAAATSAGMTMEKFGALVSQNAFGMGAFGTTAEDGAKNFAKTSKALRAGASDLYALGYSTQQINEGLAKYGSLMRSQGQQGKLSNDQLAAGAKNYMKELDLLSKATGEDRKTIEARQAAMALDAQFQASMAGLGPKVRDSFMAVTTGVPKDLESFTKDIMANGVATTEENQKLMAMMPQSAAMLADFNAKTQRGEAITQEERNRLNNLMKSEGTASLKNIKQAGAASSELSGTVKGLAAAATINEDALKTGAEQQTEAQKKTDAMNQAVEQSKQKLAEFSNGFQMALANSGMLDTLMKAFEFTANFVMQYVVPLFSVLSTSIGLIVGSLIDSFGPAVNGVGGFFNDVLLPAIGKFTSFLVVDLIPAVAKTFDDLRPVLEFLGGVIMAVAGFITDNLTAVLVVVAGALGAYYAVTAALTIASWAEAASKNALVLATLPVIGGFFGLLPGLLATAGAFIALNWPIFAAIAAVVGLVAIFKKLGGDTQVISDAFKLMGLKVKDWMLTFQHALFSLINKIPGFRGDFDKDLEEISNQQLANQKERDNIATGITERMAKNREAAGKEDNDKEKKRQEVEAKIHQKGQSAKATGIKQQEDANKKDKAAKDASVTNTDYNANGADLLKQFAKINNSELIPKDPAEIKKAAEIKDQKPAATTAADTVKKTIEADGEKKTADAKKAEDEKKAAEDKKTAESKDGTKKPTTQETAESLLAELNTKMAQLLKFSAQTTTNTYETFNAAKGLQGNLFKR